MDTTAVEPVDLAALGPAVRRRLYWSCYLRAFGFVLGQCAIMLPLEIGAVIWSAGGRDGNAEARAVIASAVMLLISSVVGYFFVCIYVRRTLQARPGVVRFVLVEDPGTR